MLTIDEIKQIKKDYEVLKNYSSVWRMNKDKIPSLKSPSTVRYWLVNHGNQKKIEDVDFSSCDDHYWIGFLISQKPTLSKTLFRIKEYSNEINDWYSSKTGKNIYSNQIRDKAIIDMINEIIYKTPLSHVQELNPEEKRCFISGIMSSYLKFSVKEITLIDKFNLCDMICQENEPVVRQKPYVEGVYTFRFASARKIHDYLVF